MVFTKTLSWGLWQFFPTGTYAGIGTTCVEFENVMKSATKKKKKKCFDQVIVFSRNNINEAMDHHPTSKNNLCKITRNERNERASLKSSDYYWPELEPVALRATGQVRTLTEP